MFGKSPSVGTEVGLLMILANGFCTLDANGL